MTPEQKLDALRELHTRFGIYDKCEHEHTDDDVVAGRAFDVECVGVTCGEALLYSVCKECHTVDGNVTEYTEDGEWPCATMRIVGERPAPERESKEEPRDR